MFVCFMKSKLICVYKDVFFIGYSNSLFFKGNEIVRS